MKEKFVSDGSDDPRILVIRERKFPWWILLLLLPLILLIPIGRTVRVQISEQGTQMAVAYYDATLKYPHRGTFGGFEYRYLTNTTDSLGRVEFDVASQPLWVVLFVNTDTAFVSCNNGCYAGTFFDYYYKYPRKDYLSMTIPPILTNLTIQVIDAENREPLPDCDVEVKRSFAGDRSVYNTHTDEAGNIYITDMPICGQLTVKACRDGFACDSIHGITGDIANNPDSLARIIRLRPLKANVVVIVRDLNTREFLPGATVTLTLGGQSTTFRTNTNGVGIVVFDNQRILETMELAASKQHYHDTTMTDIGTVRDFVARTVEQRTMYLRPITHSIDFLNTDGTNPLDNVKNEVYINGRLYTTILSNRNGRFSIAGILNTDVISIVSSKQGYNTNNTKVKDKTYSSLNTQESRTIPLTKIPPPPPNNQPDLQGEGGDLRINLQWNTPCDLDLHVTDPCGHEIYYPHKRTAISCQGGAGTLDVDANAGGPTHQHPQENIYWMNPPIGNYKVVVHNFAKRTEGTVTFTVTIIDLDGRRNFRGRTSVNKEKVYITTHIVTR